MKLFFMYISVLCLCMVLSAKELISTQEDLDAAFIYLVSKNTTWPDEKKLQSFRIAIVDNDDKTLKAFQKLTRDIKLKNRPITIERISLGSIANVYKRYQVLYLSKGYAKKLSYVLEAISETFPVLIITKDSDDLQHIMVNLYEDRFKKTNIQIDLKQIYAHGLTVNNEIILAGGKKVGISRLFESSIKALKLQEKRYEEYAARNRKLKEEIGKYKNTIETLQKATADLRREIGLRKKELQNKLNRIEKKDRELSDVAKALVFEKKQLASKQAKLKEMHNEHMALKEALQNQKKLMQEQKQTLEAKEKTVLQKQGEIKALDKKIERQQRLLIDKAETIEQQGMVLYLLIVIVIMMVLFAIYFYRSKNKYELLSRELAVAKENADYANHSKSVFLANMSHELRTPLNAILGFSQLLIKDASVSSDDKKTVKSIYRAGSFLLSLINDVLDLSRIEAGKLVLHESSTNISQMLGDILSFVKSGAEKKGIRLLVKIDKSVPECALLDGDKLRQIILNYLTNAIKYSDGGVVSLQMHGLKDTLHISVKDEGSGIRGEELEDIFKPFVQVGDASEHTGTGLGLAITQKYALSMGGDVDAESEYGKGSIFRAHVKYAICDNVETSVDERPVKVVGVKAESSIKILIADDKEDNRELLKAILAQDGFEIYMAQNGEEAVEIFQKYHPHIIWMDRKMPVMSGEKATRQIRRLPGGNEVVIVGITASVFKEDEENLLESGMDDIVLKPYDIDEIYKTMQKHLNLEYIHKIDDEDSSKEIEFSHKRFIDELKSLDMTMLKELYQNTLLLDKEEMKEVLVKIAKENRPLADMLSGLIEEMQYSVIINNISKML